MMNLLPESSLSVPPEEWDLRSEQSIAESLPDRDIDSASENSNPSVIIPVNTVTIPDEYHPPSEYQDFADQRRLDVLQRMSGVDNLVQSPGDYYAEQIGNLMDECDQLGQTNLR